MKKYIILVVLLAFISCNSKENDIKYSKVCTLKPSYHILTGQTGNWDSCGIYIVIIDSCEYLYIWDGMANGGPSLTHKGNCKNSIHYKNK